MKTPVHVIRAVIVAAALSTLGRELSAQAGTATLRVQVSHAGIPIADATVRSGSLGVRTGDDGRAILTLPAGSHLVLATRLGFASDSVRIALRADQDTAIVFTLEPTTEELESIVVSSTRGERRIEDEPIRVEVLTREEIEEKMLMTPGDISMLLNETSGLRVQTTSPSLGGAAVRIQGLGGRYTQLLSDGLPLFGGQAGGLGLLQIPPMDLAQVEVIKGAASALYGAQALGGVVNLISRRPDESPTRELLLNRTSRDGTDAILFATAPLNEQVGYTLLGGFHHQERRDVDGDGWTDLAGYRRLVLRPRVFMTGEGGRSLFLTAGFMDEDREGGTMAGAVAPSGLPYREALSTRRLDFGAVGRVPVGGAFLTARAAWADQRHAHQFGPVPEADQHATAFAEASLLLPGERFSAVLGAAFQRDAYENRDVNGFDFTHTAPALFATVDLDPTPWLALAATLRADAHSEYGTFLAPRASALVRAPSTSPLTGWTARISAGSGIFAPTPLTEETEVTGLSALLPLPALRAERATTASIDLGGPVGAFEVNLSVFGALVNDPLESVEEASAVPGGPTRLRLLNVDAPARTFGQEVLVRYVVAPWHITASFAALKATEVSPETSVRERSALVPRQTVGIVGMYEVGDKGRVGIEFYYTGAQALEHNPYLFESPSYLIVGALVEKHLGPARVFLNLENLTDVRLSRHQPLVLPSRGRGGRWTTDAWTELSGRTVNGGVRLMF